MAGHHQNPADTELVHKPLCLCVFRMYQRPEEMERNEQQGKGKQSKKKRVEI